MEKIFFASDYMEGAHPNIMKKLEETNLEKTTGYGLDPYTAAAAEKIRAACGCPKAEVRILAGGTQTNATIIDCVLRPYQGVIAAASGHISVHEAGAIEYGGHKVLTLPHVNGKITAEQIQKLYDTWKNDGNVEHLVMPGMVYISQPTEYGTLYSLKELEEISETCHRNHLPLFVDGARLAYALACRENDVTLKDLGRLCDVFYIGGTKCGALFGEAVVIPDPELIPHFFTMIKQHGALLAKGRIAGVQFDVLFTDGLYEHIGEPALKAADRVREALTKYGYETCYGSPTNQVFVVVKNEVLEPLAEKVVYAYVEPKGDSETVIRFCSSWATTDEDTDALIQLLAENT